MSSLRKKRRPGTAAAAYGLPRVSRLPRSFATLLIIVAMILTAAAVVYPVAKSAGAYRSAPVSDDQGVMQTPTGPLTALDRDFVKRVRLAGLWEIPAGRMAIAKGTSPEVKVAGQHLVQGHTDLDKAVLTAAQTLNLDVPSEPSAQQQGWLKQLDAAQGGEFDQLFANILRNAHGQVFAVVAQVRASTQNSTVRDLANTANGTVLDHMKVLEGTGLVKFDKLTALPTGSAAPSASSPPAPAGSTR
ncbi:DUF4142 domain-containing protein [Kitasatospora aureofaciens]|uniref:DUF4142 domain-containing protein n=1 Tax=Kitasatospora aureofaciens TaxID=1894 RepID=UPI001C4617C3|nr:DUF4142 domain-containing protein [Kitasatospora aureofaciens]MBV6703074.1 DUF4142 domain-containing protein [Kitasatospora aureofaciens]